MTSPTNQEPSPIRGGDGSPCQCGHLDVFHNLSTTKPRRRTACSTTTGTTPCPCKTFTSREEP